MKFVKENISALVFILLVLVVENIHALFLGVQHSEIMNYGEALYYFFSQIGYLTFLPAIILHIKEKNVNSKGLYLGLCVYNFTEVIQEANILFKWNLDALNKLTYCVSDTMQNIFIIFIVLFSFYGYKRFKAWST